MRSILLLQEKVMGDMDFGKLVRFHREQRGLTQSELAERWGHTREYVSQIERGKRKLGKQEQVNRLADVLGIPSEHLDAVGRSIPQRKTGSHKPAEEDDALYQALLEPAQATVKLSWLVWHADSHTPTITQQLEELLVQLDEALAKYHGTFVESARQIQAYTHEMLGKISFDKLNFTKANGHFQEMLDLGEELADPTLITLAMVHQGDLLRKKGRYETAFRRLNAAQRYAHDADKYIQGVRWQILARAYFMYGDERRFLAAIDKAQEIAEDIRPNLDTLSTQFDLVEVLQERAQGYTMLWKPEKALAIYQETDKLKSFRPLRDLGSYTIIKAQAYAYSGEVEEGVRLALKGIALAKEYRSERHLSRVQTMYDRLSITPLATHPRMRDLKEALLT